MIADRIARYTLVGYTTIVDPELVNNVDDIDYGVHVKGASCRCVPAWASDKYRAAGGFYCYLTRGTWLEFRELLVSVLSDCDVLHWAAQLGRFVAWTGVRE